MRLAILYKANLEALTITSPILVTFGYFPFVSRPGVPYDLARGASAVLSAASPSSLDLKVLSIA